MAFISSIHPYSSRLSHFHMDNLMGVPVRNSRKVFPDSKVHGANMGPTWVLSAPDGPHVGPMNLAIKDWYIWAISKTQQKQKSTNRVHNSWELRWLWDYLDGLMKYDDVIMSAMASQITRLTIVYSVVYSVADQRKHYSSASLAFVRGIHRWPMNSPHKGSRTWKMFPFDDVIMARLH